MGLSDIVTVSVSVEEANAQREGFGVPLILAADAPGGFTERVRQYTDLSGLAEDFDVDTATYKMAASVFAQNPRPPVVKVGRLANKPTQSWTVTPIVAVNTEYALVVDGVRYSITSDGSTSATEICDQLRTAIAATGVTEGGTATLTLTSSVAGATHQVRVEKIDRLKIDQDHADPGVGEDLVAIAGEDNDWYAILNPFNSHAMAEEIADYAESNEKLFIAQTQDSDVATLSVSSDTGGSKSIAAELKDDGVFRTALIYHPDNYAFADGAWAGRDLPLTPGSETWAYKTLAGVEALDVPGDLSASQEANLRAKFVNSYTKIAGLHLTADGKVSGNEYVDVIRFRDWLQSNMAIDVLEAVSKGSKLPFTDAGIAVIQGVVLARLKIGEDAGGLVPKSSRVTVPKAADVSPSDKAARRLTGVKFDAILAGAIQAVDITGVITV